MTLDIFKIALVARDLADMPMRELRLKAGGYNTDNDNQALESVKGKSRGECIEIILTEEFEENFTVD